MSDLPFATASWPRRFLALFVDWTACSLIVIGFVGLDSFSQTGSSDSLFVAPLFVVESAVFTWLAGGSFGKLATGLRVVSARGKAGGLFNPLTLLARQAMIALVIPPLVYRPDGRGLHDVLTGTATVTKDAFETLRISG